jgi:aspartate-semialdehyde dehydrogenase
MNNIKQIEKNKPAVAICGATGAVGREMVRILEERDFALSELRLLASSRTAGERIEYLDDEIEVQELDSNSFEDIDIALFSAGGSVSKKYAPIAAQTGCVVIDNTSAFRMEADVPLVVPEVNPEDIKDYSKRNIIANPNCSTIQMVVALKPLDDLAKIKRVVVSTYQSVSGAGQKGIYELEQQCRALFNMRDIEPSCFSRQIAFNCLPHIDVFLEDGYTKEEHKMIDETRKIMHRNDLKITATTVRVPVFYAHCESINLEFEKEVTPDMARQVLSKAPGVRVVDFVEEETYPTAIDAAGIDETLVGRIRQDTSVEHGLDIWVVADNVRKGAALNAVQIAEIFTKSFLTN